LLYVSLAPGMDHPRNVEPPPWNVQQCYAHIDDNKGGEGAPSTRTDTRSKMAEKQPVASDHSKKRPGSSEATGAPVNSTSKRRRIIQDWSDEDDEENPIVDLLNPRQRKGVEQTVHEGPSRPAASPSQGMSTVPSAATSHVSSPSEGGQSSSGQQGSRGRPRWRAFSAAHRQADM
jgi:hypothetical protein